MMKILFGRSLVACVLLGATSFAFAGGGFKSRIITSSPLTITVPDEHFLRVRNFTQQGGVDPGVVTVTLNDQSANVLTASRIDTSTLSPASPETMNQVVIAGPAEVTIAPVVGATLFVTYRKEPNEGRGSSAGPITPTPTVTPAPTATPTATPGFG
jgi:hypothetical protein